MTQTADTPHAQPRYFLTYRGNKLPLVLAEELAPDALRNRNTYFRARYDEQGRLVCIEKMVYGEVEMRHDYRWGSHGRLVHARVCIGDDEPQEMAFDDE